VVIGPLHAGPPIRLDVVSTTATYPSAATLPGTGTYPGAANFTYPSAATYPGLGTFPGATEVTVVGGSLLAGPPIRLDGLAAGTPVPI